MTSVLPTHIIERLRLLAALAEAYIEHLELVHDECDLASDTECHAEQYGDGLSDDHYTIRNAKEVLA